MDSKLRWDICECQLIWRQTIRTRRCYIGHFENKLIWNFNQYNWYHWYRIRPTRNPSWLSYQGSNYFPKGISMSAFFSYILQWNQCLDFGSLKRILVTNKHSLSYHEALFHKFQAFPSNFHTFHYHIIECLMQKHVPTLTCCMSHTS